MEVRGKGAMAEAEHPLLPLGTASSPLPAARNAAVAWPLPFAPGTAALPAASPGTGLLSVTVTAGTGIFYP